jgi:DNA-binding IclR family transcriptional regulator
MSADSPPPAGSPARSPARRLLKVLDLLIEVEADVVRRPKGVSVQQAADQIGVHRSAANRIMQELLAAGYAVPNPAGKGYRVGPAVQIHLGLTPEQRHLSEIAHPYLVQLVDHTGECAHTAIATGSWVTVIDDVETGQALRVVAGRGRRVPIHCTSAGKCLLAFGAASMPVEMPARTGRTITNPDLMRAHLADIVHAGYALDDEENDLGVRCISAPVFMGDAGTAIGCIGIDGPAVRVSGEAIHQMASAVTAAAHKLSQQLGRQSQRTGWAQGA